MMGWAWCIMLGLSIAAAVFHGNLAILTPSAMEGAANAVTLCISLAGSLCLWSGVAKVMESAGLIEKMGNILRPIFRRLFPQASRDRITLGYLTANVSANLLGLGNAATPMGIAAIGRMQTERNRASDEMCLLIVLNSASVQLLPTTVAALRSSLGSDAPFDILPAVWLTSVCSVAMGISAARIFRRWL